MGKTLVAGLLALVIGYVWLSMVMAITLKTIEEVGIGSLTELIVCVTVGVIAATIVVGLMLVIGKVRIDAAKLDATLLDELRDTRESVSWLRQDLASAQATAVQAMKERRDATAELLAERAKVARLERELAAFALGHERAKAVEMQLQSEREKSAGAGA